MKEDVDFKAEFNRQAQAYAESFAEAVIHQYKKDKGTGFIYEPENDEFASINVSYNAPTTLGGKFGEYGLHADVTRNQAGEWDPSTVEKISAYVNNNVSGRKRARTAQDRVNLYYIFLDKNEQEGWSVMVKVTDEETKGTEWIRMDDYEKKGAEDLALLSNVTKQADTILENTKKKTPVAYVELPKRTKN